MSLEKWNVTRASLGECLSLKNGCKIAVYSCAYQYPKSVNPLISNKILRTGGWPLHA